MFFIILTLGISLMIAGSIVAIKGSILFGLMILIIGAVTLVISTYYYQHKIKGKKSLYDCNPDCGNSHNTSGFFFFGDCDGLDCDIPDFGGDCDCSPDCN